MPKCALALWLLSHPELRESARMMALRQWLLKFLATKADVLAGDAPGEAAGDASLSLAFVHVPLLLLDPCVPPRRRCR